MLATRKISLMMRKARATGEVYQRNERAKSLNPAEIITIIT
jgi:hypothetical protein